MPTRVFITGTPVPVNVTVMLAASSPTTVTAPVASVASTSVAPLATPVPRANTGFTTKVSIVKVIALDPLTLPAGSV